MRPTRPCSYLDSHRQWTALGLNVNSEEQSHSLASDEQGKKFSLNMATIRLTIVGVAKEMKYFSTWISCYLHGDRHYYDLTQSGLLKVRGVPMFLDFSKV